MDSYLTTGDWFATSGVTKVDGIKLSKRLSPLVNMGVWALFTIIPIGYMLVRLLTSGSTLYISIGIFIIFICKYQLIDLNKLFDYKIC